MELISFVRDMSSYIAKYMNLEKSKQPIFWNEGSNKLKFKILFNDVSTESVSEDKTTKTGTTSFQDSPSAR